MKKLMIIGADRTQVPVYKAAKRLGCETYAISIDGNYPGFDYADHKVLQNIKDYEGVADIAEKLEADGALTTSLDMALPAVGAACDRRGLPGISLKSAIASTNKNEMKKMLTAAGVKTAAFHKVSSRDELDEAVRDIGYPLVIKAVDLSASRGVNIVFDESTLDEAFDRTMEATRKDYCIAEKFLKGYECSATAFVAGGKVIFVLPTGDMRWGENDELPIGHYVPLDDSKEVLKSIETEVTKGIKALGLNNCAVNVDIMICDGEAYILEMTGRFGGNGMLDLTAIYYGQDMHEWLVKTALGDAEDIIAFDAEGCVHTACICEMLFSETAGTITELYVDGQDDEMTDIIIFAKPGDTRGAFSGPKDYYGQILARGADLDECRVNLEKAKKRVHIKVEP